MSRDTCVPCQSPLTPSFTGQPTVLENCGGASVTYRDNATQGGCAARYSKLILRTFYSSRCKWKQISMYTNNNCSIRRFKYCKRSIEL
ncbi:MAG: hypothetical protein IPQ02_18460 [Saprospiraceae bacterium]|nr:hypothetical protein [Candidatus Defluviibacterium haderslevense]